MREIYHEMKIQLSSHIKFTEVQVPVKYFYALKSITHLHEQGRWRIYTGFFIFLNLSDDSFKNNP